MTRALRAAGLRRAVAFLLFLTFLAAGTTLPGADAALHHWGSAGQEEQRPHFEAAGGCGSHLEACTLGRAATGAGAALAREPAIRLRQYDAGTDSPLPAPLPPADERRALGQPRAPPAPVA